MVNGTTDPNLNCTEHAHAPKVPLYEPIPTGGLHSKQHNTLRCSLKRPHCRKATMWMSWEALAIARNRPTTTTIISRLTVFPIRRIVHGGVHLASISHLLSAMVAAHSAARYVANNQHMEL